jgi:DNA-binding XRE family transcriptional regulator
MKAIGVYVRILRDDCQLTQAELADQVSLSEKSVRNIENGTHEPKITKLVEIVALLRGSTAHIARLMPPSASIELARTLASEVIGKTGFTDEQREYLENLTPAQKRALLSVAQEMQ